jgi:inner membrane protein
MVGSAHMEPLTHFFTGACIGRAGFNRKTAYATLAATLAAEAADGDVFWGIRGPVEGLKHHRGITHTLIGAPVIAAITLGAMWLLHRWNEGRRLRTLGTMTLKPGAPLPRRLEPRAVHWGWLYLACLVAALSHILLDWTNNYGVRPFFPFNPRWYAGSFMFIAEPLLWGLFLMAFILPGLFGLTDREIGVRRTKFRGRGWAIFALSGMTALWAWRWFEHSQAIAMLESTQVTTAPVKRIALEPYPINPFRWHAILETPGFYQTAEVNTHADTMESDPQTDVLYKPDDTPAIEAAKRTFLGRVYLDWGTWAVVRDLGQQPIEGLDAPHRAAGRNWTTVEFSDLRFSYAFTRSGPARPPAGLSGWVYIIDNREDGGEAMGGHAQK